jgi:thiamine-monophosphate kinase
LDEFSFIREFIKPLSPKYENGEMGIGDDCAIITTPENSDFITSTDTLLELRHFPKGAPWSLVIPRAVGTAVSDISAMGARCWGMTVSLTLPKLDYTLAKDIKLGFTDAIAHYRCQLVGGDTTQGPRSITVTVYAFVPTGTSVKRGTACVGDDLWVTGELGASAMALTDLTEYDREKMPSLQSRYWLPPYRGLLAADLRAMMTSCIDISDGVSGDLQHIASASGVGLQVDTRLLPIDHDVLALLDRSAAEELALNGGDDYELLFTSNPNNEAAIQEIAHRHGVSVSRVGYAVDKSELVMLTTDGNIDIVSEGGYTHF